MKEYTCLGVSDPQGAEPRRSTKRSALWTDKTVEGSACLNAALNREMKLLPYMM
jgi:hypothetical protein